MKKKVCIIGSCVTRDLFNSKFTGNWRKYFDLCDSHYQSSILNITSKKDGSFDLTSEEDRYSDEWLNHEFCVNIEDLLSNKPDVLIFDFFTDSFFNVIKSGEFFITKNHWKIKNNKNLIDGLDQISFDELKGNFLISCKRIRDLSIAANSNVEFVLNSIRGCFSYSDGNGGIAEFNKEDVIKFNDKIEELEKIFLNVFNAHVINNPCYLYRSLDSHPWGKFFVHYEKPFYSFAYNRLLEAMKISSVEEKFISFENKEFIKIKENILFMPRNWFNQRKIEKNNIGDRWVKIDAGVYNKGVLDPDFMMRRGGGFVQYGESFCSAFPVEYKERALYGGFLIDHYGHFLLETINRLWALDEMNLPVLFQAPNDFTYKNLPRYMRFIFEEIGLNEKQIIFANKPILIGEVALPSQSTILDGGIKESYINFLRKKFLNFNGLSKNRKIFLSRKNFLDKDGIKIHLDEFESGLLSKGYEILNLEEYSVEEQIIFFEEANIVSGFIGSAFHNLILCANLPKKVNYILRNDFLNSNFKAIDSYFNYEANYIRPIIKDGFIDVRKLLEVL